MAESPTLATALVSLRAVVTDPGLDQLIYALAPTSATRRREYLLAMLATGVSDPTAARLRADSDKVVRERAWRTTIAPADEARAALKSEKVRMIRAAIALHPDFSLQERAPALPSVFGRQFEDVLEHHASLQPEFVAAALAAVWDKGLENLKEAGVVALRVALRDNEPLVRLILANPDAPLAAQVFAACALELEESIAALAEIVENQQAPIEVAGAGADLLYGALGVFDNEPRLTVEQVEVIERLAQLIGTVPSWVNGLVSLVRSTPARRGRVYDTLAKQVAYVKSLPEGSSDRLEAVLELLFGRREPNANEIARLDPEAVDEFDIFSALVPPMSEAELLGHAVRCDAEPRKWMLRFPPVFVHAAQSNPASVMRWSVWNTAEGELLALRDQFVTEYLTRHTTMADPQIVTTMITRGWLTSAHVEALPLRTLVRLLTGREMTLRTHSHLFEPLAATLATLVTGDPVRDRHLLESLKAVGTELPVAAGVAVTLTASQ